jgi:hypothetical protein
MNENKSTQLLKQIADFAQRQCDCNSDEAILWAQVVQMAKGITKFGDEPNPFEAIPEGIYSEIGGGSWEANHLLKTMQSQTIDALMSFARFVEPWVSDAACNDKFGFEKSRELYQECLRIRPLIKAARQGETDAETDLTGQEPVAQDTLCSKCGLPLSQHEKGYGECKQERALSDEEITLVTGALDSLGVALADHGHQWTDGERAIYEEAIKSLWNGFNRLPRTQK